jgi:hypothetical protein
MIAWNLTTATAQVLDFRLLPAFSRLIASALGNGRDADEGDIGLVALQFTVAFGQDADGGQVVFLELIGQCAEPPAEQLYVGGGKDQGQPLRRDVLVVRRVRVGFQGIFDQLAGAKGAALVFRQVKLDGGAVSAGGEVAGIIFGEHRR